MLLVDDALDELVVKGESVAVVVLPDLEDTLVLLINDGLVELVVRGVSVVVVVLADKGDTPILEDTLEELIPLGEIVVVVALVDPVTMLLLEDTLGELVVTGDRDVVVVLFELRIALVLDEGLEELGAVGERSAVVVLGDARDALLVAERLEELGTVGEIVVVVVLGDVGDALLLAERLEELGAVGKIVVVVVLGPPTGRLVLLIEDTPTVDEELVVGTMGLVTEAEVVADVVGLAVDAVLELIVELGGTIVKEELELTKELEVGTFEMIEVVELIEMLASELVDRDGEELEVELDKLLGDEEGVADIETLLGKRLLVELLMLDKEVLNTMVDVSVKVVVGVAPIEVLTKELVDRVEEAADVVLDKLLLEGEKEVVAEIGTLLDEVVSMELLMLDDTRLTTIVETKEDGVTEVGTSGIADGGPDELVSLDEGTFSIIVDVAVEES